MLSSGSLNRRTKGSGKPPKGRKAKEQDYSPYREMINQNSEKEIVPILKNSRSNSIKKDRNTRNTERFKDNTSKSNEFKNSYTEIASKLNKINPKIDKSKRIYEGSSSDSSSSSSFDDYYRHDEKME